MSNKLYLRLRLILKLASLQVLAFYALPASAGTILITEQEASLPAEKTVVAQRGISRAPQIDLVEPGDDGHSPLHFQVRFRSFGGSNLADLPDYLAEQYPGLRWNTKDVWGYCDGSQPVVVIPVTKMIGFANRSVSTAAGVILVHGDNGKTKLTYQPTVKPGRHRRGAHESRPLATTHARRLRTRDGSRQRSRMPTGR